MTAIHVTGIHVTAIHVTAIHVTAIHVTGSKRPGWAARIESPPPGTMAPMTYFGRASLALALAGVAVIGLGGCAQSGATVATFQVAGDQTYRIQLVTQEQIDHVKALIAGSQEGLIPNGKVVRDDPGVNAPWSWHIDPKSLEFADITTEVCDGLPEYVEDHTITSDYYCPWLAKAIKLEGPGAN